MPVVRTPAAALLLVALVAAGPVAAVPAGVVAECEWAAAVGDAEAVVADAAAVAPHPTDGSRSLWARTSPTL
jgi:hypothetical protein